MAALSDADRKRIWRGLMRFWSRNREQTPGMVKGDIRAAVDAADSWLDDNAANFNNALPTAAKTNMTASQKSLLVAVGALMRHDPVMLKQMIGELD